jgi:hypothetical protein
MFKAFAVLRLLFRWAGQSLAMAMPTIRRAIKGSLKGIGFAVAAVDHRMGTIGLQRRC